MTQNRSKPRALRVVVIDDEPLLLRTMSRLIESAGHTVFSAQSFQDIEQRLDPTSFDVLITDLVLPGLTGTEILAELRNRQCWQPMILLTGEPSVESATIALRLGAFDYVSKPVTKDVLLDLLTRASRIVRERSGPASDQAPPHTAATLLEQVDAALRIGEAALPLNHPARAAMEHARRSLGKHIQHPGGDDGRTDHGLGN